MGFVTGAGLPGLEKETGEELVAVFLPCSPMPMTGYTINISRKCVIDLDMSIDQAIQFMVSCGVVSPVDRTVIESAKTNSGMLTDKSH